MGTRKSNAPLTQGEAFEIQKKEVRVLDERYMELMEIYEGSSVGMDLVGSRFAESEKATSSGNNGDGASQRGEDSSDQIGDTNRDFSETQKQMLNQIRQDGTVQNNVVVHYSGTNTDLKLPDSAMNVPETHLNLGMGLNISGGQAMYIMEDYAQRMERRKQANRESAKRSRLCRQKEHEKLRAAAKVLKREVHSKLPDDLRRLSEECLKLLEENNGIIDELEKTYGPDAISDLKAVKINPSDGKSNSTEPKTPSRDNVTPDPLVLSLGLPANSPNIFCS